MNIFIEWNKKIYLATVIADFKVILIDAKDEDINGIELDQCRECGDWKSEDEELYGDGYCAECAEMCIYCECYFNGADMTFFRGNEEKYICKECLFKKKLKI